MKHAGEIQAWYSMWNACALTGMDLAWSMWKKRACICYNNYVAILD